MLQRIQCNILCVVPIIYFSQHASMSRKVNLPVQELNYANLRYIDQADRTYLQLEGFMMVDGNVQTQQPINSKA